MRIVSIGKIALSATAVWSAVGSYRFDWNETHIRNPQWPPHAKFHNAQTMSMGIGIGGSALIALWSGGRRWGRGRLAVAAGVGSLYWITQLSAAFYPGTALFDHPGAPRFRGPQTAVASTALVVNAVATALELGRMATPQNVGPAGVDPGGQ